MNINMIDRDKNARKTLFFVVAGLSGVVKTLNLPGFSFFI